MTTVFNTALSGMNAASAQVNTAANNIANADTPGYHPRRVDLVSLSPAGVAVAGTTELEGDVDLATEAVNLTQAKHLYAANASVVKVADEMLGTLLDIFDTRHDRDDRQHRH